MAAVNPVSIGPAFEPPRPVSLCRLLLAKAALRAVATADPAAHRRVSGDVAASVKAACQRVQSTRSFSTQAPLNTLGPLFPSDWSARGTAAVLVRVAQALLRHPLSRPVVVDAVARNPTAPLLVLIGTLVERDAAALTGAEACALAPVSLACLGYAVLLTGADVARRRGRAAETAQLVAAARTSTAHERFAAAVAAWLAERSAAAAAQPGSSNAAAAALLVQWARGLLDAVTGPAAAWRAAPWLAAPPSAVAAACGRLCRGEWRRAALPHRLLGSGADGVDPSSGSASGAATLAGLWAAARAVDDDRRWAAECLPAVASPAVGVALVSCMLEAALPSLGGGAAAGADPTALAANEAVAALPHLCASWGNGAALGRPRQWPASTLVGLMRESIAVRRAAACVLTTAPGLAAFHEALRMTGKTDPAAPGSRAALVPVHRAVLLLHVARELRRADPLSNEGDALLLAVCGRRRVGGADDVDSDDDAETARLAAESEKESLFDLLCLNFDASGAARPWEAAVVWGSGLLVCASLARLGDGVTGDDTAQSDAAAAYGRMAAEAIDDLLACALAENGPAAVAVALGVSELIECGALPSVVLNAVAQNTLAVIESVADGPISAPVLRAFVGILRACQPHLPTASATILKGHWALQQQ